MSKTITLAAARVNAGYSIKEAAEKFGIHHQTLARYEKDSTNVPYSFIQQIPHVYGVPSKDIFFGVMYEYIRTLHEKKESGIEQINKSF